MDMQQVYIDNEHKDFDELSEQAKLAITQDWNKKKKKLGENGTCVTGSTLRTNEIDLDKLSESGRHKLAARMGPTRGEWDRSEFASSSVNGGSVTHSHKSSQVGFGDVTSGPQTQRAPAVSALRTRGQRVPRNLGGGPFASGFRPIPKPPAATSAFVPATTTGIGGFVPGPKAPTGISGFPPAPKAPTATGGLVPATTTGVSGFVPGPKAPSAISATTTVVRDPSVNQGKATTALSPKVVNDASQLGTGSLEQTNEQFKELIDEMAALQQV
ncbi:hypothetical protein FMUND_963 [Fusarium mundagurra]|uniref:Uncharacterized protein n=1 Tax=Fusarium mundagurra TaxID=1567541 RepID=A0A8H6DQX2_9HYPO|nr:hypothetical protein FMUND_963 [Fusarium mundagurra]